MRGRRVLFFLNYRVSLLLLAGVLLVGCVSYLLWPSSRTQVHQVTITAGSEQGLRHSIALALSDLVRPSRVIMNVEPTKGSSDALNRLNDGDFEFALAQGGLNHWEHQDVRQVAVLHIEPLHLLVKASVTPEGDLPGHFELAEMLSTLNSPKPLTINTSTLGSGTNILATDLLNFFGLVAGKDYIASHESYEELLAPGRELKSMPDVVFTVSSLPSPVAKYLISQRGYRPVELAVADAFRIDWTPGQQLTKVGARSVHRRRIVNATIPQITYQANPPVPKSPIQTLGTRLHLVAHKDTPDAVVEEIIDLIYNSSVAGMTEPPLTLNLMQTAAEFPLHHGAQVYLEKKTPIITERVVEMTEQVLAILGTICGACLFAWQGMLFVRRRRRDRQFLSCVERVGEIENRALQYERKDSMTVYDLVRLQDELNAIKKDMISQFQSGDIEGADTLSGFLMHINDATENLARLILHERQPKKEHPR